VKEHPGSYAPHSHDNKSSLVGEIADMLMESSVFNAFPAAELRSVARHFGSSRVGRGALTFKEGDAGLFMRIIAFHTRCDSKPIGAQRVAEGLIAWVRA
jgi:hypothetical protein